MRWCGQYSCGCQDCCFLLELCSTYASPEGNWRMARTLHTLHSHKELWCSCWPALWPMHFLDECFPGMCHFSTMRAWTPVARFPGLPRLLVKWVQRSGRPPFRVWLRLGAGLQKALCFTLLAWKIHLLVSTSVHCSGFHFKIVSAALLL